MHLITLPTWPGFGHGDTVEIFDEALEDVPTDIRVSHLASPEEDRRLDLVTLGNDTFDVSFLEIVIVLVYFRAKLDLLELYRFLVFSRLPLALLLLVVVPPIVHDAAHRWCCRW